MSNTSPSSSAVTIIARSPTQAFVCRTEGIDYVPDMVKHRYGSSTRKPLEDWFLEELDFFRSHYPDYQIFSLGSSLVFGERFVTYFTVCEFQIESEDAFRALAQALKSSDQAIRRKLFAAWKWDVTARKDMNIVFIVGWLDFAYFLQHRRDFLDIRHGHFMDSFVTDRGLIRSTDYKVLHDGAIVPFDEKLLNADDLEIYRNYTKIHFERTTSGAIS